MAESRQQQVYNNSIEANSLKVKENKPYLMTKRFTDFSLALIGILILIPIFFIIAILIKVEDREGAVFFKQLRVGKDGNTFFMYKFRSMVWNAEELLENLLEHNEASGPLFKMKEDPRITRLGKFLRRTSLDELPQLFNVLKGEMSLVGPRPALPREVKEYNEYEYLRLKALPGLTCLWQINGRSALGFTDQVKLDLEYINKRTLLLDLKIIFKTFFVLFGSKDAY
jgi:lipopolysaccharide/colanic/teichoic acid biosynthesis glycosyltransferase